MQKMLNVLFSFFGVVVVGGGGGGGDGDAYFFSYISFVISTKGTAVLFVACIQMQYTGFITEVFQKLYLHLDIPVILSDRNIWNYFRCRTETLPRWCQNPPNVAFMIQSNN